MLHGCHRIVANAVDGKNYDGGPEAGFSFELVFALFSDATSATE
jgi:hypothetical protein